MNRFNYKNCFFVIVHTCVTTSMPVCVSAAKCQVLFVRLLRKALSLFMRRPGMHILTVEPVSPTTHTHTHNMLADNEKCNAACSQCFVVQHPHSYSVCCVISQVKSLKSVLSKTSSLLLFLIHPRSTFSYDAVLTVSILS